MNEINKLDVDGFFRAMQIVFGALTEKERCVLFARRGINIKMERATLEVVGREMGVTRERVRQLEAKAHEKLRSMIKDIAALPTE